MKLTMIALHSEDGEYVKKLPEGWYSSDGYGDKMVQYLQERNERYIMRTSITVTTPQA